MKKRAKQFYFTKNDDALWDAIQNLPEGERNHEIRRALRHWFLEGCDKSGHTVRPIIVVEKELEEEKNRVQEEERKRLEEEKAKAIDEAKLPDGLVF